MASNRTGSGAAHWSGRRRAGRPVSVVGAVLAAAAIALSGCSDDVQEQPEVPDAHFYISQGTEFNREDLNIGVGSISDGTAALHLSADDIDGVEVVRAGAGDSVEAGHRTITVHRVDEGGDEGIAVTIEGMEAPTPVQDDGDKDGGESADDKADPMDDPEVFATSLGNRRKEEGVTFALGAAAEGRAWILVSAEGHEDEQVEVEAGDEIEFAGKTFLVVEVEDGSAYLKVTG